MGWRESGPNDWSVDEVLLAYVGNWVVPLSPKTGPPDLYHSVEGIQIYLMLDIQGQMESRTMKI